MRIILDVKDLPESWYNIIPDLVFAFAPRTGQSGFPVSHWDLASVASHSIINQELENKQHNITIPHDLHQLYSLWRPTPLFRAERLEKLLETPARIFYKYEGSSPSGSYEFNTALAQAYFASTDKREGIKCLVTATGNGEWGISLAIACNYFNIKCKVYMVRSSYEAKHHGRHMMELLGADVVSSPCPDTRRGKKLLSEHPDSPGSISIALSEAYEEATRKDDTKFAWGTVMNHVLLHQTMIGLESRLQLRRADAQPDICIASVGGGSGFGGLVFPFYQDRKRGIRFIAVESAAAPSLTKGRYAWDYADADQLGPMLKMYTLGHSFVPPNIEAGGMRYHGISPSVSALYREKHIEAKVYTQRQAFDAAVMFARTEGFIPSPESSYAIKAVVDEAITCKNEKEKKNILFLLSTSSNLEITTFKKFLDGKIEDKIVTEEEVQEATANLPEVEQE